jgi:hypothetical protein
MSDEPIMAHNSDHKPTRALIELLSKALIDQELRAKLFAEPEAVAREFEISTEEAAALKTLDREKFERAAARLRWS